MEKIFLIIFPLIPYSDLDNYLNVKPFAPKRIDGWYVLINPHPIDKDKKEKEPGRYEIYDSSNEMIGKMNIEQLTHTTSINFYLRDDDFMQQLLFYIRWIIDIIRSEGFTVQHVQSFHEAVKDFMIDNKLFSLPKKELNYERLNLELSNFVTLDKSDDTSKEILTQADKPWEQIDARDILKEMVCLMHEGLSAADIAEKLAYEKSTIYKRTSEMRQEYGCKVVPYFQKWRKCED